MEVAKDMARQGDILFVRVDKLPQDLKKAKDQTVALGEVTGHSHRIAEAAGVAVLENEAGDKFVTVADKADVVHQEHGPIALGPGDWQAIRQQEYTPKEPVKVRD
jgi:hypothetical protein